MIKAAVKKNTYNCDLSELQYFCGKNLRKTKFYISFSHRNSAVPIKSQLQVFFLTEALSSKTFLQFKKFLGIRQTKLTHRPQPKSRMKVFDNEPGNDQTWSVTQKWTLVLCKIST